MGRLDDAGASGSALRLKSHAYGLACTRRPPLSSRRGRLDLPEPFDLERDLVAGSR